MWATDLTYTLTDVNGAKYTGSWDGTVGTAPSFTGCSGYTLTGESWDGTAYSATINFPFAISSNSKENQTFIGSFHNKPGYYSEDYLWHANGTTVIVHSEDIPNATSAEQDKYLWVITPSISDLNITFTIKNVSTGTYIYSTTTESGHSGAVTLNATASTLTYSGPLDPPPTNSTARNIYAFIVSATSMYLSVNSVNGGASAQLGVYNIYHDGTSVGFHNYADLISRYWTRNNIATGLTMLGNTGYPAASNSYAIALNDIKSSINSGSYAGTSDNYGSLYTNYSGLIAADVILPSTGFYRIKSSANWTYANRYLMNSNHATQTGRAAFDGNAGSSINSIWYYNGTTLYGYGNGGYPVVNNSSFLGVATAVGASATSVSFQKANKAELGSLNVKFNGSRFLYTDNGYTNAGSSTNTTYGYNFIIEAVTSLPVTISSVGYATLWSPVALTIPTGVTAYTATDKGTYLTLTAIEGTTIPKGTGVILKGDEGPYNFNITSDVDAVSSALTGSAATIAKLSGAYYLGNGANGIGFYLTDNSSTITTLAGFKAYLPAAVGVKEFLGFDFDDATAIQTIGKTLSSQGTEIFNLSGQRISRLKKGVNIVNGKKVLVK